jgi:hypothetical protein
MTLNLMLTSKDAVFLSADFRLTSVRDGAALQDSYDTQKLIPVIRHDWSALIAYMGVACAPPLISDMGQWIGGQIASMPPDGSPTELFTRLLTLNDSLARIRGDRRVAMSVVGFRNQRPFMMLLSNFLDLDGKTADAGPQLRTYLRTPNQAEVRAVGGLRPDVFERVRLERLLRASSSRKLVPELISQAIAEINANTARRSKGAISEECVSGYLLRSGVTRISAHGIPDNEPCFPAWVRTDLKKGGVIGFKPKQKQAGNAIPIQWKGMTARILNGAMVRVHEIANAGKPILDDPLGRPHSPIFQTDADRHRNHLRRVLKHTALMRRDRLRRSTPNDSEILVLDGGVNETICVLNSDFRLNRDEDFHS